MEHCISLYFGSFNPVHTGHLDIAGYVLDNKLSNEVWFVISPQNPLKSLSELAPEHHRLEMLEVALSDKPKIKICDIEFSMPKPSYTIHTLNKLIELNPGQCFQIIMGMDNLQVFRQWKSWEEILDRHQLLVYPRRHYDEPGIDHSNITVMMEAPLFNFSSSMIRQMIKEDKQDLEALLPSEVIRYIRQYQLYV
jgi:nicotinate-nucleotide adenylyltransferase